MDVTIKEKDINMWTNWALGKYDLERDQFNVVMESPDFKKKVQDEAESAVRDVIYRTVYDLQNELSGTGLRNMLKNISFAARAAGYFANNHKEEYVNPIIISKIDEFTDVCSTILLDYNDSFNTYDENPEYLKDLKPYFERLRDILPAILFLATDKTNSEFVKVLKDCDIRTDNDIEWRDMIILMFDILELM